MNWGQTPDESIASLQPVYPYTFVTGIAGQFLNTGDRPLDFVIYRLNLESWAKKIC